VATKHYGGTSTIFHEIIRLQLQLSTFSVPGRILARPVIIVLVERGPFVAFLTTCLSLYWRTM
jgi:hypothetical protein